MQLLQFEFYHRITADNYIYLDMITQEEVISKLNSALNSFCIFNLCKVLD